MHRGAPFQPPRPADTPTTRDLDVVAAVSVKSLAHRLSEFADRVVERGPFDEVLGVQVWGCMGKKGGGGGG